MIITKRVLVLLLFGMVGGLHVHAVVDYKSMLQQVNPIDEVIARKGKIVYVDMVGDLFHSGHVKFLAQARALGDYLIVGLNSDEDCAGYKRVPILTLAERVAAALGCRYVDAVLPAAPMVPGADLFDTLHVTAVAHGDDFTPEKIEKYYGVAVRRGIFHLLSYTRGVSTSEIINRIVERDVETLRAK